VSRLDDTSRCPVADTCASCPSNEDLAVATAETPVGVYCLTLCASCADAGRLPRPRSAPATVLLVMEHCGHLGITADEAAELLDAEKRGE
jgi:hypothetical protein